MKYIVNKQIQSIIVGCQSVCSVKKLRSIAIFLTDHVSKLFNEIEGDQEKIIGDEEIIENGEKISKTIFNILEKLSDKLNSKTQSVLYNLYMADNSFSKETFPDLFNDIEESKREDYIKDFSSIVRTITFWHLNSIITLLYKEQNKIRKRQEKKSDHEHKLIMDSIDPDKKYFLYYKDPNEEKEIDEGSEIERILAM